MKQILFLLLISFSNSCFSSNKCQGLFSSEPLNLAKDEVHYSGIEIDNGYRESFSKLSDIFRKYIDSKNEIEKSILKEAANDLITSIQMKMSSVLDQKGILYELAPAFSEYTNYYQLNWSFFKLKTVGPHWLNKMAKTLNTKLGVDLVYDPISLSIMGFGGAFWQFKKTLTLSEESILLPRISYIEGHELIHAHFWGYRAGLTNFDLGVAPVHIEMRSKSNIDKNADPMATVYQNYMSFEEMVTFSYNILFSAKNLEASRDSVKRSKLLYEIAKLKQISKNVLIASDLGLNLIEKKDFTNLTNEGLNYLLIGKQDAEFGINIYIYKSFLNNTGGYAKKQLELAKELASFNLKHLDAVDLLTDIQLIELALKFRDLQKDFIQNLQ